MTKNNDNNDNNFSFSQPKDDLHPLEQAFCAMTKLPRYSGGADDWQAALEELRRAEVEPSHLETAVRELKAKNFQVTRLRSVVTASIDVATRGTLQAGATDWVGLDQYEFLFMQATGLPRYGSDGDRLGWKNALEFMRRASIDEPFVLDACLEVKRRGLRVKNLADVVDILEQFSERDTAPGAGRYACKHKVERRLEPYETVTACYMDCDAPDLAEYERIYGASVPDGVDIVTTYADGHVTHCGDATDRGFVVVTGPRSGQ